MNLRYQAARRRLILCGGLQASAASATQCLLTLWMWSWHWGMTHTPWGMTFYLQVQGRGGEFLSQNWFNEPLKYCIYNVIVRNGSLEPRSLDGESWLWKLWWQLRVFQTFINKKFIQNQMYEECEAFLISCNLCCTGWLRGSLSWTCFPQKPRAWKRIPLAQPETQHWLPVPTRLLISGSLPPLPTHPHLPG